MANMFSGNREKEIPKTFVDCYKTDNVTDNLWTWAERLETIGKVLAVILAIIIFIASIIISINEYDGSAVLIGIISAPIVAFLEYITFHIIALLVGSLASIVQNTKISANIELYRYAEQNNGMSNNEDVTAKAYSCACGNTVKFGQERCEKCGRKFDWTKL